MKKLCFEITSLAFPIRLYQKGKNRFDVHYGKQLRLGLTYQAAAKDLGQSILHALACDGKIDNRGEGEI